MKHDLNALESDDGVRLPPFITRSTAPLPRTMHDPAWMQMRELFAKFEISMKFNQKELCHEETRQENRQEVSLPFVDHRPLHLEVRRRSLSENHAARVGFFRRFGYSFTTLSALILALDAAGGGATAWAWGLAVVVSGVGAAMSDRGGI